jgi:hypothetical protein
MGLVELGRALALATTAIVTARLGAIASSSLSERVLQRAMGAFMICVAPLATGKTYDTSRNGMDCSRIRMMRTALTMALSIVTSESMMITKPTTISQCSNE